LEGLEEGLLYLQLNHTPSLALSESSLRFGRSAITPYTTVIPLQQRHLDAIMDHLYTARFVVADSRARRYSVDDSRFYSGSPLFPGVPDGTYEFYNGKLSQIYWQGLSLAADKDNPLYKRTLSNIQKLFNLGIEMSTAYSFSPQNQNLFPHRYAYFRDGDLYLLGAPIIRKDDPTLIASR
jgi:signal peptidase I